MSLCGKQVETDVNMLMNMGIADLILAVFLSTIATIGALNEEGVSRAPGKVWDLVPDWVGNGQER